MTVLEVGLGVGLFISLVWWAADHMLKVCEIEKLEAEVDEYWSKWEKKSKTRNRRVKCREK